LYFIDVILLQLLICDPPAPAPAPVLAAAAAAAFSLSFLI